ncbi:phage tail protein [Pendulispora brunnea]|uniref:Phage tail protein n=1 Tax=Pendulispora brunnea TaxID=2905690 RepID=A0ABZ2KKY3_9BACT
MPNPLPAFRYRVVLVDTPGQAFKSIGSGLKAVAGGAASAVAGGFTDCSGLEVSVEMLPYAEGGVNGYVHKLPTRTNHTDIVLKRGLLYTSELSTWIKDVASGTYQRKNGYIVLLAANGKPAQTWWFVRGLPTKWSGPTLSSSQNGVATEALTIAHEGLFNLADEAVGAVTALF